MPVAASSFIFRSCAKPRLGLFVKILVTQGGLDRLGRVERHRTPHSRLALGEALSNARRALSWCVADHREMIVILQTECIRTIEQVAIFVKANEPVEFQPLDRDGAYDLVARTLAWLGHRALDKPPRALVKCHPARTTGYSRPVHAADPPAPRGGTHRGFPI